MKNLLFIILFGSSIVSCKKSETIPIADNTFVFDNRVYKVIDNEITELANLDEDTISKSLKPDHKIFDMVSIGFVKKGATTDLSGVYRGDMLFLKMKLEGINDLRENYSGSGISINLKDEYGFNLKTLDIQKEEIIRIVDNDNQTSHFEYHGNVPLSAEVYKAIKNYDISSSLTRNNW